MSDYNEVYESVLEILEGAPERMPWKTANTLAKGLQGVTAKEVEQLLMKQYSGGKSLVRYSTLPSKRTLEVLWGHTKHVGFRALKSLIKENEISELEIFSDYAEPEVFLSHSHQDFNKVKDVAEKLFGKRIGVWMAEASIMKGEPIHEWIIQGLENCHTLLLYLSDNSLRSTWTGKEVQVGINRNKRVVVVLDEGSESVQGLLACEDYADLSDFFQEYTKTWEFFSALIETEEVRFFWENQDREERALGRVVIEQAEGLVEACGGFLQD